ncbi:malate dehydrogenase (quinone) [Abyssicoccus albus]|uniref:malate dehydrogenase (quinone) n=1 Tax=Abyssicoccus albus TaxID=1817405 RepID=UPI00097E28ED|nr:malate dehydrogenase (quinone) [Abyssicoccus albus]AQL55500.1 malate dehydrogenase (quinone) [Abyssicoccus albus]
MNKTDVILIGGGIMSATLGTLLKKLDPTLSIRVFEKLDGPAQESSNVWNNAGTGHSALCELNYTKEQPNGVIDIKKAINVNEQFQVSKQFWSYLVKEGKLQDPSRFIMPVPHMSFVLGKENVEFLKKRVEMLNGNVLFEGMEFSDSKSELSEWAPLMMEGRTSDEPIAMSKMDAGTDVNFGQLTKDLFEDLEAQGVEIHYSHEVKNFKEVEDGSWQLEVQDHQFGKTDYYNADFVFIGAGGHALPLLQKTGIKQSKHVGGFPVSGVFLTCSEESIAEQHLAKVYGKAEVGAPPMSVPHLDTRYIDGKRTLLFGPFAGFSPKFLKSGSYLDLIQSVKPYNVTTMLASGAKEMPLTKYLIGQLMLSHEDRMEDLRKFVPTAKDEDWSTTIAGQRVQVIKDTETGGKGTLQFGTEVVTSDNGSIAALLGASPGASTAVSVMIDLLGKCFPERMDEWDAKLKEMIPSYGQLLTDNPDLFKEINKDTAKTLGLNE